MSERTKAVLLLALLALAGIAIAAPPIIGVDFIGSRPPTPYYSPLNLTQCIADVTGLPAYVNFTITHTTNGLAQIIQSNLNGSMDASLRWSSVNFSANGFGYWTCSALASNTTNSTGLGGEIYNDYPLDWPQWGENRNHLGYSAQAGPATNATSWVTVNHSGAMGSPTVSNNTIYVGTNGDGTLNGSIIAFYANNGTVRWRYNGTVGQNFSSAPAVAENLVFIAASQAGSGDRVIALTPDTGAVVWQSPLIVQPAAVNITNPQYSSPVYDSSIGVIVFASELGRKLIAFDASTGAHQWNVTVTASPFGGVVPCTGSINMSPTTPAIATTSTGAGESQTAISSSSLVLVAQYNYTTSTVGCDMPGLRAYTVSSGLTQWTANMSVGSRAPPLAYRNLVYVASADGNLSAFHMRNGSRMWSYVLLQSTIIGWQANASATSVSMIAANDTLHFFYSRFHARLNATTGAELAALAAYTDPESNSIIFESTPSLSANQLLFATTRSGYVHAINLSSGAANWSYKAAADGSHLIGTPAIAGRVFASNATGAMFSFGTGSTAPCGDPYGEDALVGCFSPNITWLAPPQNGPTPTYSGTANFNVSVADIGYGLDPNSVYMMIFPFVLQTGGGNVTPWILMNNASSGWFSAFNKTFDTTTLTNGDYVVRANATDLNGNQVATVQAMFNVSNGGADTVAPNVSFINPGAGQNASGLLNINLSVNDSASLMSYVQFRIGNWSANATPWLNMSLGSGTGLIGFWNFTFNTSTIADGTYNITINATDGSANSNKTVNVSFTVDNTVPRVALNAPADGLNFSGAITSFNFTPTDTTTGILNCSLYLNNTGTFAINMSNTSTTLASGSPTNLTPTSFADGHYLWNVQCFDFAGNSAFNTSNRTLTMDLIPPVMNVSSPANGSSLTPPWPILVQANDTSGNLAVTFMVAHATTGANITPWLSLSLLHGDIYSGYWSTTYGDASIPDATYNITFNATDFAGRQNASVIVQVTKTTSSGGEDPPEPPPGCNEPGGPICPPPPGCNEPGGPICPPPCDPSVEDCGGEGPPPEEPEVPPGGAKCTVDGDCTGSSYCNAGSCEAVNGTCGFAFDHKWAPYECCSNEMCATDEQCNLQSHICEVVFKPPVIEPNQTFTCSETCGNGGGSGACCSGYCENSVCVLKPPAAAQAVSVFSGIELKNACAGLGLGLDEFSCNLMWLLLLAVSALAGFAGSRTRGRLAGAALLMLPIFAGLLTFVSAGIALALIELALAVAIKPKKY